MAQGDQKISRDYALKAEKGTYSDTDTYSLVFSSDTYASYNIDATNPQLSDITVTSGGNFPASTDLVNFTITRATTTITFDANDPATFSKNAANPADVRTVFIINNTSVNDDIYTTIDLTEDGTTPLDLVNNDFVLSFNANGIHNVILS